MKIALDVSINRREMSLGDGHFVDIPGYYMDSGAEWHIPSS
jgi:hypothetical protein